MEAYERVAYLANIFSPYYYLDFEKLDEKGMPTEKLKKEAPVEALKALEEFIEIRDSGLLFEIR